MFPYSAERKSGHVSIKPVSKHIQILHSPVINQVKWDHCIYLHANGLIYSGYDYLDTVCDEWSGLIIGDYEAVMALPWKKKMGIRYYYIPPFIQQLGLIGSTDQMLSKPVIQSIRRFAVYGDIHFNFSNHSIASTLFTKSKTNFIINLNSQYEDLSASYSIDLKQILQKSNQQFEYTKHEGYTSVIETYYQMYGRRMSHISSKDFSNFTNLCKLLNKQHNCLVRSVRNESGTILSNALLLRDNKRLYLLLNTTSAEGRLQHSNHWLIDKIIREFAGTDILLDFEGSELTGVKTFYKKFGGHIQPYFHYRRNFIKGH